MHNVFCSTSVGLSLIGDDKDVCDDDDDDDKNDDNDDDDDDGAERTRVKMMTKVLRFLTALATTFFLGGRREL